MGLTLGLGPQPLFVNPVTQSFTVSLCPRAGPEHREHVPGRGSDRGWHRAVYPRRQARHGRQHRGDARPTPLRRRQVRRFVC